MPFWACAVRGYCYARTNDREKETEMILYAVEIPYEGIYPTNIFTTEAEAVAEAANWCDGFVVVLTVEGGKVTPTYLDSGKEVQ